MKRYHFGPRLAVMMAVIALILALCEASGVAVSVPEAVEEHVRVSEEIRRREAEEWRDIALPYSQIPSPSDSSVEPKIPDWPN